MTGSGVRNQHCRSSLVVVGVLVVLVAADADDLAVGSAAAVRVLSALSLAASSPLVD